VVRFEVRLDDGPFLTVGKPSGQFIPGVTPDFSHSYSIPLSNYGPGTHALYVRACDAVDCSESSLVMFKANTVSTPRNPRVVRQ
jgi:hypothetical protein